VTKVKFFPAKYMLNPILMSDRKLHRKIYKCKFWLKRRLYCKAEL